LSQKKTTSAQPLYSANKQQILGVNGEIYNHKWLKSKLNPQVEFATQSDCECIIHLYNQRGINFLNDLEGIFAFCLVDEATNSYVVARDHMGIIPLYYGFDETGTLWVASELKALHDVCVICFEEFPPGHVLYGPIGKSGTLKKWYNPVWHDEKFIPNSSSINSVLSYDDIIKTALATATATATVTATVTATALGEKTTTNNINIAASMESLKIKMSERMIKEKLESAVVKQLMSDVPYGVLLSGGLDSSIIAAIAARHVGKRVEDDGKSSQAWWPRLHTFSIGLKDSPDLKFAQQVATYLGTQHHEFIFTVEEGFNVLQDVIYHLETFDITTIRASVPMYLLARRIKTMGIKMVLSGEGSDEMFGGYLYFHKAPNREEFHTETVQKLKTLHKYDCLRANKSTAAWGVETRVPFLEKEFLDFVMTQIDPTHKMCGQNANGRIEKALLRNAFEGYLPASILNRQKEQFSDGVGYSWINELKATAERTVSDEQMAKVMFRYPQNSPFTKEGYFYRSIFDKYYPQACAQACVLTGKSVACSTPAALRWHQNFLLNADPSGRSVSDLIVVSSNSSKKEDDSKKKDIKKEEGGDQQTNMAVLTPFKGEHPYQQQQHVHQQPVQQYIQPLQQQQQPIRQPVQQPIHQQQQQQQQQQQPSFLYPILHQTDMNQMNQMTPVMINPLMTLGLGSMPQIMTSQTSQKNMYENLVQAPSELHTGLQSNDQKPEPLPFTFIRGIGLSQAMQSIQPMGPLQITQPIQLTDQSLTTTASPFKVTIEQKDDKTQNQNQNQNQLPLAPMAAYASVVNTQIQHQHQNQHQNPLIKDDTTKEGHSSNSSNLTKENGDETEENEEETTDDKMCSACYKQEKYKNSPWCKKCYFVHYNRECYFCNQKTTNSIEWKGKRYCAGEYPNPYSSVCYAARWSLKSSGSQKTENVLRYKCRVCNKKSSTRFTLYDTQTNTNSYGVCSYICKYYPEEVMPEADVPVEYLYGGAVQYIM
jgi:asparagine synthase (glutamine-hydrolysing)